ncbi:unnamed protein product [Rotaria sordida]|uniref:Circadian locomoter output cycles protein kaput-like n=1 Tax=Rotaria sordida TaxID=392033 RepID=A0A814U7N8_9BILA|nr:unnamed protein product [Rotaria sordida]CAF4003906.1 unnamed protein product [Rotaria sordida]
MNKSNTNLKRTHTIEDSKHAPAKRQFRNENEKRRRDLFSQLVANLEDILNIEKKSSSDDQINKTSSSSSSQTNKLDKASILCETAIYLRKHHHKLTIEPTTPSSSSKRTVDQINDTIDFSWKPPSNILINEEWIQTTIESMNCFFLVTKSDPYNCQIVYVSKNISSLLDYSQNELLNRSLFEFISPRDHDHLRDYFLKDHRVLSPCDLSWKRAGTDEHEQCTIIGAFRQKNREKEENDEKYLMSIVKVNTLDRTILINNFNSINQFTTRLNLHGRFIHIDSKAREFLGYSSYELIGHTHFDFVHPDDLPIIVQAHQIWKTNGNGKSEPYRFLSKGQQWIYLQTHCQVQINSWTGKPESYLCTTYPLQNSSDSLQKPLSYKLPSSRTANYSIQSPLTTTTNTTSKSSSQKSDSSSDTQIKSFLSHLGNETYRRNIRDKLNEHRLHKQAEIRIREDEIKIIEDIVQFINEFELKRSTNLSPKPLNPSLPICVTTTTPPPTTTTASIDSTSQINQEDSTNENNELKTTNNRTVLSSASLIGTIDELSLQSSSMKYRQNSSTDNPNIRLSKDENLFDTLTNSLFSPQQGTFCLSSPITSFSILSHSSPATSITLSISPTSTPPPSTQTTTELSPSNNYRTINNDNDIILSSTESITTNPNPNMIPTEKPPIKSSFNRSLPHSLVS